MVQTLEADRIDVSMKVRPVPKTARSPACVLLRVPFPTAPCFFVVNEYEAEPSISSTNIRTVRSPRNLLDEWY